MEGASLIKKPRPSEAEAFDPCDVCCCCFSSAPHAQDAHAEGVRLFRAPLFSACFDDAICACASLPPFCSGPIRCVWARRLPGHVHLSAMLALPAALEGAGGGRSQVPLLPGEPGALRALTAPL